MIDDILLFIKVVEAGSILAVEKSLKISKSTISRRIQGLEQQLGNHLLNRNTHGIELTMLGYSLYEKFHEYDAQLADKLNSATVADTQARGKLNILSPYTFTHKFIIPQIDKLLQNNPHLQINISHNSNEFNMQKEMYDIAIVNYPPKQQSQKVKLIASDKLVIVCTPQYIEKHGLLSDIKDHLHHQTIGKATPSGATSDSFPMISEQTGEVTIIKTTPQIFVNNFVESKIFVANHQGIAGFPLHYIRDELASGALVRLLPEYYVGMMNYYLMRNIAESDRRYQVFYSFLMDCLREFDLIAIGAAKTHLFHQ